MIKKRSSGELIMKFLECLTIQALDTRAFLMAFLKSCHSSSILSRQLAKELKKSERDKYIILEKQEFYNLISKLRKEGFITGDYKRWQITEAGNGKLIKLKSKLLPRPNYKKEKDREIKIFTFDIKERERYKRGWLRGALRSLGFYMLQNSVWVGKVKVPADFIQDLKNAGIISDVHLFAVSKEGTLHKYPINLD